MLFLPVTRLWSVEPVVEAFDASDVPKSVILLADAPLAGPRWATAFHERGWTVELYDTNAGDPPADQYERRARHLAMRQRSQELVKNRGPVLFSEDDTLIPADTWSRLTALVGEGAFRAASGIQFSRHDPCYGVWKHDARYNVYDPFAADELTPGRIVQAAAVGHYCLLTEGFTYWFNWIRPRTGEPIDIAHTRRMAPVAVDTSVRCGHLLENGDILV